MGANFHLRDSFGSWLATGRKSMAIFKVPAVTLCAAAVAYALELIALSSNNPFAPLKPGTWCSVIEWCFEGLAIYALRNARRNKPDSPARGVAGVLAVAMACN